VNVHFLNGTARQRDWFVLAMDHARFPWQRISTQVEVEWVDFDTLKGLQATHHHDFAFTLNYPDPADPCGRPNFSKIWIRDDLDDPQRPGTESNHPHGYYAGQAFYEETVMHELGHVVQGKYTPEQISRLTLGVYGGHSESDWNDEKLEWWHKRQESDAETFKDVWLPRPHRKFDNRTNHRMNETGFGIYLSVLDNICPCEFVGACFESNVAWFQRSGGDIGFDPTWFDPQIPDDDVSALGPSHPFIPTWGPFMGYRSVTFIVRAGGVPYETSIDKVNNPNPYYDSFESPLTTYWAEFYDIEPENGVVGWRLLGVVGAVVPEATRFFWNPRGPALIPHQFGGWQEVVNTDPVTRDNVTGWAFVAEWALASLKFCDPEIIT
jgi:hypothetical protein